jgi:hypothetical protein
MRIVHDFAFVEGRYLWRNYFYLRWQVLLATLAWAVQMGRRALRTTSTHTTHISPDFMKKKRLLLAAFAASLAFGLNNGHAADAGTLPTVTADAPVGSLAEEAAVGPYNKPEWTDHRRFSTTRVYLQQDPGDFGVELWWRNRSYKDSSPQNRFMSELEIGLPGRLQLDFYYNWVREDGSTHFDEFATEVRWALADWGKIWGNPTLYLEYALVNHDFGGDTIESKILFGDDFGKGWHWGLNFVFETEISHEREKEFVIAGGISRTIVDQVLSAGIEWQWKHDTVAGDRGNAEVQFEIGPSFQWRPSKNTHIDIVALAGCTNQGPKFESFLIFGWDFGGGSKTPLGGGKNAGSVSPSGSGHYVPVAGLQH